MKILALIVIGYFVLLGIVWIIGEVRKFLETRRYKTKLEKLSPQLNAINIKGLVLRVSEIKTRYSSLIELLQNKYKIGKEKEQVKTIEQYVEEEANYRRRIRKPPKKTYRRKYWRYRRYY